jgi:hypothetical protein
MAAVVRIAIQEGEAGTIPHDDVILLIIAGLRDTRKNALLQFRLGGEDVLNPPRCMQTFHTAKLKCGGNKESRKNGSVFQDL